MAIAQERDFYAEAILLLRTAKSASLATARETIPFAALVTPALTPDLSPLLLLSTLSTHTRHLQANPACALLVAGTATDENPQTAPRICLSGNAIVTNDPVFREIFLAAHPYANLYIDFVDFSLWRMDILSAHYVGGFAAAASLDVAKLKAKGTELL